MVIILMSHLFRKCDARIKMCQCLSYNPYIHLTANSQKNIQFSFVYILSNNNLYYKALKVLFTSKFGCEFSYPSKAFNTLYNLYCHSKRVKWGLNFVLREFVVRRILRKNCFCGLCQLRLTKCDSISRIPESIFGESIVK